MKAFVSFLKLLLITLRFLSGWLLFAVYCTELMRLGSSYDGGSQRGWGLAVVMLLISLALLLTPTIRLYQYLRKKQQGNNTGARILTMGASIVSAPFLIEYFYKKVGRDVFLSISVYLDEHASGLPLTLVTIVCLFYALLYIYLLVRTGPIGFLILLFFMLCLSILTNINTELDGVTFFHNNEGEQSPYAITIALVLSSLTSMALLIHMLEHRSSQLAKTLRGLSASLIVCAGAGFVAVHYQGFAGWSSHQIILVYLSFGLCAFLIRFGFEKYLAPGNTLTFNFGLYWKLGATAAVACLALKICIVLVDTGFTSAWLIDIPSAQMVGWQVVPFSSLSEPREYSLMPAGSGFFWHIGLLYYTSNLALRLSLIPDFLTTQLESVIYGFSEK